MNSRNYYSFTICHICKFIRCTLHNLSQFERKTTFEGDKKQLLRRKHLAPKKCEATAGDVGRIGASNILVRKTNKIM
jgi:hypothetical protein